VKHVNALHIKKIMKNP